MRDFLFEYDHMLIRSDYHTPDKHSHFAVHLVIALDEKLNVVIEDKEFQADAVFIDSDLNHTIYEDKGEMLVYLCDSTIRYATEIHSKNLIDSSFLSLSPDIARELQNIWKTCD